jgi:hypothetical protein
LLSSRVPEGVPLKRSAALLAEAMQRGAAACRSVDAGVHGHYCDRA